MAKSTTGAVRFAMYLRCSTDDQKHGDFTTIDTQRDINASHIAALGGVLTKVYADEGRSGTNLKRPDWQALLRDAEAHQFDRVCVTYMSRLARGEAYHIAEYLLKERSVEIELVRERFTPDLAGHVNKQMTILMDGMYPKMVSQWTRTKMEQMVAKGYCCGQIPAMGYRKEFVSDATEVARGDKEPPKRLVVNMEEAMIVRRAFEVFAETRNYPAVVDYLRGTTGRKWTIESVTRLIRNDVFTGVQRFGPWVNTTAHEAIVSQDLWNRAIEADQSRAGVGRTPRAHPKDDFTYYLRGLVFCPHCGGRMTPVWHRGESREVCYYECLKSMKRLTQCPVRRVNANTMHQSILNEIDRAATHPTRLHMLVREAAKLTPEPEDLSSEFKLIERRLVDIDRRMARCQEAIEVGTGALLPLVQRLEVLQAERLQAEAKREEIERMGAATKRRRPDVDQICALWRRIPELWGGATEEERTQLMQAIVLRVEMEDKEKGACEIALAPQAPVHKLELNSHMGAGVRLELTTFGL